MQVCKKCGGEEHEFCCICNNSICRNCPSEYVLCANECIYAKQSCDRYIHRLCKECINMNKHYPYSQRIFELYDSCKIDMKEAFFRLRNLLETGKEK